MKIFILAASLLMAACGGDPTPSAPQADDRETVFDPLTDQLDKAKAVEDKVEQHKQDIDAALRESRDE